MIKFMSLFFVVYIISRILSDITDIHTAYFYFGIFYLCYLFDKIKKKT